MPNMDGWKRSVEAEIQKAGQAATAVDDLAAWLTQIWDELEWWATEASRRDLGGFTPTGEHWHWECGDDHPVTPDPLTQGVLECAEGNFRVSLRSVEQYPTASVGPLPHFALSYCEEVPAAVAGHILRHDPAAELARIAADRQILKRCAEIADMSFIGLGLRPRDMSELAAAILADLALPHADRPGYQEAWRPA